MMEQKGLEKNEIPDKMLEVISANLEAHSSTVDAWRTKLAEMKNLFLESEAVVYCEDCSLVFYYGNCRPVVNSNLYFDFKMLAFRHVWDTRHKVKIYLPYIIANVGVLAKKNPTMYASWNYFKQGLTFDESNCAEYYKHVESLRERLTFSRSPRVRLSHDENWDERSECACSVCYKMHHDPKQACLCHQENKPYLPAAEVESIQVRSRR